MSTITKYEDNKDICVLLKKFYDFECEELNLKLDSVISDLPTDIIYPEITDNHLEHVRSKLQRKVHGLKDDYDCESSHSIGDIKYYIKLLLFLTYAQFVLSLVCEDDPKARHFICKSEQKSIRTANGKINHWTLKIPSKSKVEEQIECTESHKFKAILHKIVHDSKERDILREMVECYYLVEIVEKDWSDSDINRDNCKKFIYSYVHVDDVSKYVCLEKEKSYLSFDFAQVFLKSDLELLVYRFITHALEKEHDCESDSNDYCEAKNNDPNICTDISIIVLYVLAAFSKYIANIDLLKYLSDSDILNADIKKRICTKITH
jgi:hypothetical protein